jgi:ribosomal protein S18 acetylase RimI-like enzyme
VELEPAVTMKPIRQIDLYVGMTDFESVKAIYNECFPLPFTVRMLEQRLERAERVWVYLLNNEIVGYLLLDVERGHHYLSQVATRASARRMGVATGLITTASDYLRGMKVKYWWLQTEVNNPAQKLYFDLGFRVSGFERDTYGFGKHGVEMTQILDIQGA